MANVLLHSLVFSPDGVSTSYLMTDLAREIQRLGHTVVVLTTTPHYNLDPVACQRQPMKRRWLGLIYESRCDGMTVWHVKVPMKGRRVATRVVDYVYFHLMALIVALWCLEPVDIVLAPSPPLTIGIVGWLLARRRRVPFVYNVQEIYPDVAVNQGVVSNTLLIRVLQAIERFVYRRSTKVVVISEWFRRILGQRGVPASKLAVIPNFVDTELFHPLPRDNPFSQRHQLRSDFVVSYGGNIGLSQDWESLLYAGAALRHLPIRFVVVGDGARREWLQAQVAARRLANVQLVGYQPRETMAEVNAASDLCTIPARATTTTDTLPSKIYTILACGKSVLVQADRDSELHWLVTEHGCGRSVEPGDSKAYTDALLEAYHQRQRLAEEGERGLRFVQQEYSKEAVASKYDLLIRELIAR
jgi:glycosyltransferase involved in cell wall biosynthesis